MAFIADGIKCVFYHTIYFIFHCNPKLAIKGRKCAIFVMFYYYLLLCS